MAKLSKLKHLRKTDGARVKRRKRLKAFLADEATRLNATATPVTFTATNGTETLSAAAHGLSTGDPIRVVNAGGALPAPLVTATDYYAIRTGTGTFQLATTRANALRGTAINLTTDGTGTNSFTRRATTQRLLDEMRGPPVISARRLRAATDIDNL